MTSPTKNQQPTSTATRVFNQASYKIQRSVGRLTHSSWVRKRSSAPTLTVNFLQLLRPNAPTRPVSPTMALGISAGVGGRSSDFAYFQAVLSPGFALWIAPTGSAGQMKSFYSCCHRHGSAPHVPWTIPGIFAARLAIFSGPSPDKLGEKIKKPGKMHRNSTARPDSH